MWLFRKSSLRDYESRKWQVAIPPKRHGMAVVKSCVVVNHGNYFRTVPNPPSTAFGSVLRKLPSSDHLGKGGFCGKSKAQQVG